ncbi:MAG: hypothetical protein H0X66_20695 [Verrucomicrobia bacterium]|nr:hypothetical protein [Verrucomicrobiota bacterium]
MNAVVLTFTPEGDGRCLYTELIELDSLGRLEVDRASTIEFNNVNQFWEVKNLKGHVQYFSRSRTACLAWEHQQFNR